MKPPAFDYLRPESLEETLALLSEHAGVAKPLAGGQSLIPLLRFRLAYVDVLIDVARLPEVTWIDSEGDDLRIGAGARQSAVELSTLAAARHPLLAESLRLVAHTEIRNRGTFGGSLAHADPAAELPAAVLALDGELELRSAAGSRQVSAADFFLGHFTTALAEDELLTGVRLPGPRMPEGTAILEATRRIGDFALAGAVVRVGGSNRTCELARVVVFAVGPHARRIEAAELALVGSELRDADLAAAAEEVRAAIESHSDLHASAEYRQHAAGVLCRRALESARERLRGGPE